MTLSRPRFSFVLLPLLAGFAFISPGCNKPAAPPTSTEAAAEPQSQEEEIEANIAKLSPEDQELARAQKMCPVGDSPLGSMGAPFKAEVNGQTVFLCCEGCEDGLKADPDKYLAKLGKQTATDPTTDPAAESKPEAESPAN